MSSCEAAPPVAAHHVEVGLERDFARAPAHPAGCLIRGQIRGLILAVLGRRGRQRARPSSQRVARLEVHVDRRGVRDVPIPNPATTMPQPRTRRKTIDGGTSAAAMTPSPSRWLRGAAEREDVEWPPGRCPSPSSRTRGRMPRGRQAEEPQVRSETMPSRPRPRRDLRRRRNAAKPQTEMGVSPAAKTVMPRGRCSQTRAAPNCPALRDAAQYQPIVAALRPNISNESSSTSSFLP